MKYILILTLILTNLFSAPAYNAKRIFKQADGTEFTARLSGNHILNWVEDENGEILKYNPETKNYEYAIVQDSKLKPSGVRYSKQNAKLAPSKAQRAIKKIGKKDLSDLLKKRKELRVKQLYK